jgi:asparagine synthase (glutamine-hydrolysing)
VRELTQFRLPVSADRFDLPFSGQVALLDEALQRAVARHAQSGGCGLLLSGGRDSRTLAGLLRRNGNQVVSLTLGRPGDLEMGCALAVADQLGFEHRMADTPPDQYWPGTETGVKWEHLAGGLGNATHWGHQEALERLPPRCASGYTMDAVVGGSHIHWAYAHETRTMSFERFFGRINRAGLAPDVLKQLLRPRAFRELVEDVVARLRARYLAYADLESQRAWCFDLHHRQRFQIGRAVWPLAFATWPLLPMLDRDLLSLCGSFPASALAERRAQDEILCTRFPDLAQLPLDRNSYDTEPLRPRLRHLLAKNVRSHLPGLRRAWRRRGAAGERRHYYRIYDVNGPGWVAVRREAERHREGVLDLFDRDTLQRLLPAPETVIVHEDPIVDASGTKLLLGLLLWCRDHR